MEFLLKIVIRGTRELDDETREKMLAEEHARGEELARRGHLVRMWRTPGVFGNWSLWRAEDATDLHEIISGFPFFPFMEVDVHPLARHRLDPPGADEA